MHLLKMPHARCIAIISLSLLLNHAFASSPLEGKKIAFDRKKGNCIACHAMEDGDMPGNIGPPLTSMRLRFPNRTTLKAQIWDASSNNPLSVMPPFGKHQILSSPELEQLIDYLYTL